MWASEFDGWIKAAECHCLWHKQRKGHVCTDCDGAPYRMEARCDHNLRAELGASSARAAFQLAELIMRDRCWHVDPTGERHRTEPLQQVNIERYRARKRRGWQRRS